MRIRLDPLQAAGVGAVCFHRHQGPIQGRPAVAEALEELVAVHDAPQLAPGGTAGGHNQRIRAKALPCLCRHGKFPAAEPGSAGRRTGIYSDIRLLQGKAEDVHHAGSMIAQGVNPPIRLSRPQKA